MKKLSVFLAVSFSLLACSPSLIARSETYTVTGTNYNNGGVEANGQLMLTWTPCSVTANASVNNETTACASNGSATVTPGGGTSPYTYSWTNGNTNATATGLSAGTYTVSVTDISGCSATSSVTITELNALTVVTSITKTLNCNGDVNGSAKATASGGATPYDYSWSNGTTSATDAGLSAGTYSVSVSDKNSCNATAAVTLTQPALLTDSVASISYPLCNGQTAGATIGVKGGISPYTYTWATGISTTATATGLSVRTYTVKVKDSNGCSATVLSFNITQPYAMRDSIVSAGTSNITCNGNNNGNITVGVQYGVSPYTYTWTPNVSSASSAAGLSTGTYSISISDVNGCSASVVSYTITQPANILSVTPVITNILSCNGNTNGAIVASTSGGSAPYTYTWSPNLSSTATVTGLSAGTYSVSVSDKNSCNATAAVTLTQPALLTDSMASISYPLCNGQTAGATIGVKGGISPYTYTWATGISTTATATGLSVRTYTVKVKDSNGCSATVLSFNITQPYAMRDSIVSAGTSNITCNGNNNGNITVGVQYGVSPYTYTWTPDVSSASSAAGLSTGTYSISISDVNGCSASIVSYTITQPNPLAATASVAYNVNCNGGTNGEAVANVSGGAAPYTYNWTNGSTASIATGLSAGTYEVRVNDKNGCRDNSPVIVTQPALLMDSAASITYPLCNGGTGSAIIGVKGGATPYTYKWTPDVSNTYTATGLAVRSYTVLVTDNNGCSSSSDIYFAITQPYAMRDSIVSASIVKISCSGASSGSITVGVQYGVSPYTYSWSPNVSSTDTARGLSAGTYSVSISDSNGCSTSVSYTVTQPTPLVITPVVTSDAGCYGDSNGIANVTVSGDKAPYTYTWPPSRDSTKQAKGLTAGTYTATVTDALGCTATGAVTVTQPTAIIVTTHNDSVCSGYNVQLSASASGGAGGYTYNWITGANTDTTTVAPLSNTPYTIYVTDSKDCLDSAVANVKVNFLPIVVLNATSYSVCSTDTADALLGLPAGGVYRGPGVTGGIFNPSEVGPGTWYFSYIYTDSAGCSSSAMQNVIVNFCPTGIPTISNSTRIAVYPNPATNQFTLELLQSSDKLQLIELYSITGQQLYGHTFSPSENSQLLTISAQQFPNGIYFLKAQLQDGSTFVQKVEIMK